MISTHRILCLQLRQGKPNRNLLFRFDIMLATGQMEIEIIGHDLICCQCLVVGCLLKSGKNLVGINLCYGDLNA